MLNNISNAFAEIIDELSEGDSLTETFDEFVDGTFL